MGLWWAQPTSWSNKIIFIQWTDFTQCAGKFSHHNGCFFICSKHFISISRSLYSAFRSHLESAGWFYPHIQQKMGLSYRAPDSIRAGRLGLVTFPYLHDNKMYARCENCTHTSCMRTRRVWVMWEMCVCECLWIESQTITLFVYIKKNSNFLLALLFDFRQLVRGIWLGCRKIYYNIGYYCCLGWFPRKFIAPLVILLAECYWQPLDNGMLCRSRKLDKNCLATAKLDSANEAISWQSFIALQSIYPSNLLESPSFNQIAKILFLSINPIGE